MNRVSNKVRAHCVAAGQFGSRTLEAIYLNCVSDNVGETLDGT